MNNHYLPSLLLVAFFCQNLSAQIVPTCPEPGPPGAEGCSSTCVYCDLNGFMGINNGSPSSGSTVCGQIAIHNDQWFGFIAGSESISITVYPSNCQNGDGLQTAFFADCSDPDALVCAPGMPGGADIPLELSYDNFSLGETYFLMIDGWSGDVCDFAIEVTGGILGTIVPADPTVPIGPSVVCPGSTLEYHVDEIIGAGYYQWTAPPGSQINGLNSPVSIEGASGATVTITFGNVGGNICVRAGDACHGATSQYCLPVTVQPIPTTILPLVIVCNEDTPYVWPEEPFPTISNPGIYTFNSAPYDSYLGCDSIVRQTIFIKAPIFTNLGSHFLCQGACYQFGDSLYCNSGTYTQVLDSYQGCDSTVAVHLDIFDPAVAALIQTPQGKTITCLHPTLTLQGGGLSNLTHLWINSQGDTLGTSSSITVNTPGFYIHQVSLTQGGNTCEGVQKILIKQNTSIPPVTASGGTISASNPTVQLHGNSIISGVTYSWTGPNGYTSNQKNPVVSVPGSYTLTVTNPATGCSNSITVEVQFMI